MQEAGRAMIESSDGFFCIFVFFRGCSNRCIVGIYRERCMRLPLNEKPVCVAVILCHVM